jgi:IclR family acetate operon transcriptional repressor
MLRSLRELCGETVNLGIMGHDGILNLDILESGQEFRTSVNVGARDHLHSTVLGKAMLASLSASEARAVLYRTEMVAKTPDDDHQNQRDDRGIGAREGVWIRTR